MKNSFINSILFRSITPAIYGVLVYILILLFFDSIKQLASNFFSLEVILCIIITYLIFELMRLCSNYIQGRFKKIEKLNNRILLQISTSAFLVFIATTFIITLYYKYLVGFLNFNTELIVFNSIYLFTCIFYNMLYFSIMFLGKTNDAKLQHEYLLKKTIETELQDYKGRINPNLLYNSLEHTILLVHKDKTRASEFVQQLSDVYRYIVSSKKNEPIELSKELEFAKKLSDVLNPQFQNSLIINFTCKEKVNNQRIIPGTLHAIIENIVHRYLITEIQPLRISCNIIDNRFIIEYTGTKRLLITRSEYDEVENIMKVYKEFTKDTITIDENDAGAIISVPLIY